MRSLASIFFALAVVSWMAWVLQMTLGYPEKKYHALLGLLFFICSLLVLQILSLRTKGPRNLFPFHPPVDESRNPIIYALVPWVYVIIHVFFAGIIMLFLLRGFRD